MSAAQSGDEPLPFPAKKAAPAKPASRKKRLILGGVVAAVALAGGGGALVHARGQHVYANDARIASHVVAVSAEAAGKLVELAVDPGDTVRKGQLLARIEPRDAEYALAKIDAQIAAIEAQQAQLRVQQGAVRSPATQTPDNPATMAWLGESARVMQELGVPAMDQSAAAGWLLGQAAYYQASAAAFRDGFLVVAVVFLAALLPTWLLHRAQRPRPVLEPIAPEPEPGLQPAG